MIALYFLDAVQKASGGSGLSPLFLVFLLLPGILVAWLSNRSHPPLNAEKEAVFAGLTTALFASLLLIAALITAAANIDWATYQTQVGAEIANAVRSAVIPAATIAGIVAVILVYTVCVSLSWLGSLIYNFFLTPKQSD